LTKYLDTTLPNSKHTHTNVNLQIIKTVYNNKTIQEGYQNSRTSKSSFNAAKELKQSQQKTKTKLDLSMCLASK
jgi:hypothetical protein